MRNRRYSHRVKKAVRHCGDLAALNWSRWLKCLFKWLFLVKPSDFFLFLWRLKGWGTKGGGGEGGGGGGGGGGGCWGHEISSVIEERACGNSRSQLKKSGISKGGQEKFVRNFHGPWFLILEFPSGVTQFCRIYRGESLFSPGFLRVRSEFPAEHFQKIIFFYYIIILIKLYQPSQQTAFIWWVSLRNTCHSENAT